MDSANKKNGDCSLQEHKFMNKAGNPWVLLVNHFGKKKATRAVYKPFHFIPRAMEDTFNTTTSAHLAVRAEPIHS